MMDVWVSKVICLVLILLLTIIFGLLPIRVVAWLRRCEEEDRVYGRQVESGRGSRARNVLGYMNCFSGGVFLGACFLHLLPEVIDKYEVVMKQLTKQIDFPLAELLIMSGFFLIMLIEHGVMSVKGQHGHSHGTGQHRPSGSHHSNGYQNLDTEQHDDASALVSQNTIYGAMNHDETLAKTLVEEDVDISPQALANSYASYHECGDQLPHHHHPGQTHEQTVQIHGIRSFVFASCPLSAHSV